MKTPIDTVFASSQAQVPEYDQSPHPFREQLIGNLWMLFAMIVVPEGPGPGVEVRMDQGLNEW